jgi:CRP-like cAMP-binding protein
MQLNSLDPGAVLSAMIRKFEKHTKLGLADREALLALPYTHRRVTPGTHLVRDGDYPDSCCLLITGFAYRHKITGEGARQIISLHLPGDFIDLQNMFLSVSDHNVQALTHADIAFVPKALLSQLAMSHPLIARAMWIDTLIDASIFREWVVNVGRRDSRARVAHLLCEFALRLESAGLSENHRYTLPMTQEQLADSVGLTPVHVNRVLKALESDGLISRDKRALTIEDWHQLSVAGDFHERYLHHEVKQV